MAEPAHDLRALVLNYRGAEMTMQVVRDLLAIDDICNEVPERRSGFLP